MEVSLVVQEGTLFVHQSSSSRWRCALGEPTKWKICVKNHYKNFTNSTSIDYSLVQQIKHNTYTSFGGSCKLPCIKHNSVRNKKTTFNLSFSVFLRYVPLYLRLACVVFYNAQNVQVVSRAKMYCFQ